MTLPGSTAVPALDGDERVGALRGAHAATARPRGGRGRRLQLRQSARAAGCSSSGLREMPRGRQLDDQPKDPSPPAASEVFTEPTPSADLTGNPGRRAVPRPLPARHRLVQPRCAGGATIWHQRRRRREGRRRTWPGVATTAGRPWQRLQRRRQRHRLQRAVAARHRQGAALLAQRRVRDARLRGQRREAPHGERHASPTGSRVRATERAWSRS